MFFSSHRELHVNEVSELRKKKKEVNHSLVVLADLDSSIKIRQLVKAKGLRTNTGLTFAELSLFL